MFKRLSELFKPKKSEPDSPGMPVDELPAWLNNEEQSCISRRTEYISKSREAIEKSRADILELLKDFGTEETEELLHPKVEQVNRHNLPQFKRKIEAALDQQFSDDDETYYRQVAEMIDGCFKAYKGPGRYLHHLYQDEVKLFRQSMDQIGRELNQLTDIIKVSRIRLGRIESIRHALERYTHSDGELNKVLQHLEDIRNKKGELEDIHGHLVQERDQTTEGPDFRDYRERVRVQGEKEKKVEELYETLDSLIRTALVVWRKALRIAQDERDREKEKFLDRLIQVAVLQNYADPDFLSLVSSTASGIYTNIEAGTIPIRNSFEKALFGDRESYISQISDALNSWKESENHWKEEQKLLAVHPAAECFSSFENRIHDISREINHQDEEIGRSQGKIHHLNRELDDAVKNITSEMKELTGASVSVTGLKTPQAVDG